MEEENNNNSLLLSSLKRFYSDPTNTSLIKSYIQGTGNHSLRMIDWFVTNYSKNRNIILNNDEKYLNVYVGYRSQLRAYSKHKFDPFRRRHRINLYIDETTCIESTLGQLNFFRWLIQHNIIDYIDEHALDIEHDMLQNVNRDKGKNIETKNTSKLMNRVIGKHTLNFE